MVGKNFLGFALGFTKIIFILSGLILGLVACEPKKKELSEDDIVEVSLAGKWSTTAVLPTKSKKQFAIRLQINNVQIRLVPEESFCKIGSTTYPILPDNLEKRLHRSDTFLYLSFPRVAGNTITLSDCQIAWRHNDSPNEAPTIIKLGDFHFNDAPPEITIDAPTGTITFPELIGGNQKIRIKSDTQGVAVLNTPEFKSCIDLTDIIELSKNNFRDVRIDVDQLNPPNVNGGQTDCVLTFQDGAGNKVTKEFSVTVAKPIFTADITPRDATFSRSLPNSGRSKVVAKADSAGQIRCDIYGKSKCFLPQPISASDTSSDFNLEAMYVGDRDYTISYTPTGATPGGPWDTVISIYNVRFHADVTFTAELADVPADKQLLPNKRFHDAPRIELLSNQEGEVSFRPAIVNGQEAECPKYAAVTLTANNAALTASDGRRLAQDYPANQDTKMSCIATFKVTSPADLAGTEVSAPISYIMDKKKPEVTLANNPVEIKVGESASARIVFSQVSEEVVVVSDSCFAGNKDTVLRKSTASFSPTLSYDFSNSTVQRCSVTFRDYIIDVANAPAHEVITDFHVVINRPILEFLGRNIASTTSGALTAGAAIFSGTSGQGLFEIDTPGILYCYLIGDPTTYCLQGGIAGERVIPDENQKVVADLVNLKAGKHKYKFTLIPIPPYEQDDTTASAKYFQQIEADIEAGSNPPYASAVKTSHDLRKTPREIEVKFTASHSGSVSYNTSQCPTFPGSNPFNIARGSSTVTATLDGFTDAYIAVNCLLTLHITENGNTERYNFNLVFDIDAQAPTLTVNNLINNAVTLTANYGDTYPLNITVTEESKIHSTPNGCLGRPQSISGTSLQNRIISVYYKRGLTDISGDTINYKCKFQATDNNNNTSNTVEVTFTQAAAKLTISQGTKSTAVDPNVVFEFTGTPVINVSSTVNGNKLTCTNQRTNAPCGELHQPPPAKIEAGRAYPLSLSSLSSGENSYVIILFSAADSQLVSATIKINVDNNVILNLTGAPADGSTITSDVAMTIQPTKKGTLKLETVSGKLCFESVTPANITDTLTPTALTTPLPNICKQNNFCQISCSLSFTETETGTSGQATHTFDFAYNTKGVPLSSFTPGKDALNDVEQDKYVLTFGQAIKYDPAALGEISIRDFDNDNILYKFADSEVTVTNNKLNLQVTLDKVAAINKLATASEVYIHISKDKVLPATGTGIGFPGICSNCGISSAVDNRADTKFYNQIKLSKLKELGAWKLEPSGDIAQYDMPVKIKCDSNKPEFCIKVQSGIKGKLKLVKGTSLTALDIADSISIASNDITIEHSGFDEEGGTYYVSYSESDKDQMLLTSNDVRIAADNVSNIGLKVKYVFAGVADMLGTSKKAVAAYGLRQLRKDYDGPLVQVVALQNADDRDGKDYSRSTLKDIKAYTQATSYQGEAYPKGHLNMEELKEFVDDNKTAAAIGVFRWYDQSGGGRHLQQFYSYYHTNSSQKHSNLPIINKILDGDPSTLYNSNDPVTNSATATYNHKGSNRPAILFFGGTDSALKNLKSPILRTRDQVLNHLFQVYKSGSYNYEGSIITVASANEYSAKAAAWGLTSSADNSRGNQIALNLGRSVEHYIGRYTNTRGANGNRGLHIIKYNNTSVGNKLGLFVSTFSVTPETRDLSLIQSSLDIFKADSDTLDSKAISRNIQMKSARVADWSNAYLSVGGISRPQQGRYPHGAIFEPLPNRDRREQAISELIFFKHPLSQKDKAAIARSLNKYFDFE